MQAQRLCCVCVCVCPARVHGGRACGRGVPSGLCRAAALDQLGCCCTTPSSAGARGCPHSVQVLVIRWGHKGLGGGGDVY